MTNTSTAEYIVDIKLNDNTIERVTHTKFLVLNVNAHLSWEFHVNGKNYPSFTPYYIETNR